MNKLGFAIKLASQGAGNAIECNKGQWVNKVVDIREYLKLFNGLQGTDNIVTFMSFDDSGCFLTQLRAISGRGGDFLSGWIYIPNTIEATGEDIMNAYNYVRNILSQSNLSEYKEDIESFFSKEFPQKKCTAQYIPSSGEEFGVRFNNVYYSMKEILDVDRYQPYYSSYKAIFLLDKDGEVKIAKDQVSKFKDLTKQPLNKTCIFNAPSPEEVRLLGRGTKIIFQTRQEFKSPVLTKMGDKIHMFAVREGFEPIPLPVVTIQEDGQTCPIDPNRVNWMKRISPSMFRVYNGKHEKIEKGVRVFIFGKEIPNQGLLISEDDCRHITVKITATDYEDFEQQQNLLSGDCEVILSRKVRRSTTIIMLSNGNLAEMTLESKDLPSNKYDSPIKGYDFEEDFHGNKVLKISSWFVWKQRLWGFLGALAAAALIIAYIGFDNWSDTHHFKFGLPPWEEDRPAQTDESKSSETADDNGQNTEAGEGNVEQELSLEDAIKYLDGNSTWKKSDMEKYPDLQGLFDDMNNFKFEKLLNDWSTKLNTSLNFKKVCESANKTFSHKWNPKQGSHNPTYNKPGDEQIRLTNYINWLDQDQTPHEARTEPGGKTGGKSGGKTGGKPGGKLENGGL